VTAGDIAGRPTLEVVTRISCSMTLDSDDVTLEMDLTVRERGRDIAADGPTQPDRRDSGGLRSSRPSGRFNYSVENTRVGR